MRRGGLLWTFFPPLVTILVVSLVLASVLAGRAARNSLHHQIASELESLARVTAPRFASLVTAGDEAGVQALCEQLGPLLRGRVTVILPGGRVIGDSHEDPGFMDNHADRPEIMAALAGEVGQSERYSTTTRLHRVYVAVPAVTDDGIYVVRTSRAVSEITHLARVMMARIGLAGLGMALIAGLASWIISRRLRDRLVVLRDQATAAARGELDQRVHAAGPAELMELGEAMNRMNIQLGRHIAAVEGQRQELEAVLDSMVEGVLAVDSEERIIRLNHAATGLLGVEPERAMGRSIQEVGRHSAITRLAQTTLATGETSANDIRIGAGDTCLLQVTATELVDGEGERIGALLVMNDVTRLRRLENMRRDFVANVSHELKTPITSIKGFVETLLEAPPRDPADGDRFLGIINRQVDRLDAIISDLLALSRLEKDTGNGGIERQDLPLTPVLERVVRDLAARDAVGAARVVLACDGGPRGSVNAALLEQAVGNLLQNALKYSPEGTPVELSCQEDAGDVRIAVADRGPGIAPEHLPRLFERFYRVDRARSRQLGGTGLGLAIVKHIAQAHRGQVTVASELGHGSTFTLVLPKEDPA